MCPPGVDQTTRTQERWTLLTPLLKEKSDLTNEFHEGYEESPQKCILGNYTWDAFDKLAQGGKREFDISSASLPLPHSRRGNPSALERMPAELLDVIINDPSLKSENIIALGLSSQFLWLHALAHIANACRKAPWAGTPLLCTGSWLRSIPPAIHALYPKMKHAEKAFFTLRGHGPRRGFPHGMCPAREFNWGAIGDYADRTECNHRMIWLNAFAQINGASGIPAGHLAILRKSLQAAVNVRVLRYLTKCILRNLTTNEYVILKASRIHGTKEPYTHVSGMPWLSLDKALILRICWAALYNDEDVEEEFSDSAGLVSKLKRGAWAGHCFDVVPAESTAVGKDWVDVTTEIAREGKAWKRAFGG